MHQLRKSATVECAWIIIQLEIGPPQAPVCNEGTALGSVLFWTVSCMLKGCTSLSALCTLSQPSTLSPNRKVARRSLLWKATSLTSASQQGQRMLEASPVRADQTACKYWKMHVAYSQRLGRMHCSSSCTELSFVVLVSSGSHCKAS